MRRELLSLNNEVAVASSFMSNEYFSQANESFYGNFHPMLAEDSTNLYLVIDDIEIMILEAIGDVFTEST